MTPLAIEQLGACTTTTEPKCCNCWSLHAPEPVLQNKRGHSNEKPMYCNWRVSPIASTREKPMEQWKPSTANKQIKLLKIKRKSTTVHPSSMCSANVLISAAHCHAGSFWLQALWRWAFHQALTFSRYSQSAAITHELFCNSKQVSKQQQITKKKNPLLFFLLH